MLAGASLNVVQSVMRHSTITLTIDTYGHMMPGAEAAAVDGLAGFFSTPELEKNRTLKTGTDDGHHRRVHEMPHEKLHAARESHAGDTQGTAGIMSPAGLEPTTYGLELLAETAGVWRSGRRRCTFRCNRQHSSTTNCEIGWVG